MLTIKISSCFILVDFLSNKIFPSSLEILVGGFMEILRLREDWNIFHYMVMLISYFEEDSIMFVLNLLILFHNFIGGKT